MLSKLKNKFLNLTLKKKIVYLIVGVVTITPTILIGLLASVYYYLGVESLFNEKVSEAISNTVSVAKLYLNESNENIKLDLLQIEKEVDKQIRVISQSSDLNHILNEQVKSRGIAEAMIFTKKGVIAKSVLSFSLMFQKISPELFKKVEQEKVVLLEGNSEDKVRAVTKLDSFYRNDVYLIVGKYIDEEIINYLKKAQGSAKKYHYLLAGINITKQKLQAVFIILSTLMCFFSFLISIKLASIITNPLNKLLSATSRIKEGDYSARVQERESEDEVASLERAFNKMARTIEKQHNDLKIAYKSIDERVKFIETVLKEISSGVIALNAHGYVSLYNNFAKEALFIKEEQEGNMIFDLMPEIKYLVGKILKKPRNLFQDNIIIKRKGRTIHLFIKIGAVIIDNKISNIVISFEDITELISAQREAAWSDVARRIAHEIKNPLTPLQLSAERLKSKYSNQIEKGELENYQKYIDTIIRNVNDIHAIVSEFIQFGRIPKPKLGGYDIITIIQDVMFSQKNIYRNISYIFKSGFKSGFKSCYVVCDKTQITQVLTNIAKNSAESIGLKYKKKKSLGVIQFAVNKLDNSKVEISIEDNGGGIDEDLLTKIPEPYVSSKKTGMGLGLSIVKKVLQDHKSSLNFTNTANGLKTTFNLETV